MFLAIGLWESISSTLSNLAVAILFSPIMEKQIPMRLRVGMSSGRVSRIFSLREMASFQFLLRAALMASCCKSCVESLFMLEEIYVFLVPMSSCTLFFTGTTFE